MYQLSDVCFTLLKVFIDLWWNPVLFDPSPVSKLQVQRKGILQYFSTWILFSWIFLGPTPTIMFGIYQYWMRTKMSWHVIQFACLLLCPTKSRSKRSVTPKSLNFPYSNSGRDLVWQNNKQIVQTKGKGIVQLKNPYVFP